MEALECGAASLSIILGFYGRFVPLEELRVACGVSRDGSKASNIVKAARTYGLVASGKRLSIQEVERLKLPFVVFWNFNHFLVVEGFAGDTVFLSDPASGKRKVSRAEFKDSYTGVTLVFEPGEEFEKSPPPPGMLESLLPRLKGSKGPFIFVILASLALVIPGLVIPVFSQIFVDDYLVGGMDGWIKPLLLGVLLAAVLRITLTWLQQSQLLRLGAKLSMSTTGAFLWHVLRLPVNFFSQRYASDISQRVPANDRVADLVGGQLATSLVNIVAVIFYVFMMLQYDWVLTLVGILITCINLLTLKYLGQVRKDGNLRLLQDTGKLMATTMNGIQTIETIKSTGAENDFFARWLGYKAKVLNSQQDLELYTRLLSILPTFLNTLANVAILGFGGMRVIDGDLSVGMLVAFQSLMMSFTQPITELMGLAGKMQEAEGDLRRLDDVLNYPLDKQFQKPPAADSEKRSIEGNLELKNIVFGYSRLEPPLIEDLSLCLKPGQRIALVGGSGSGKSTISKLVMGLQQPWSGTVLLDHVKREDIPPIVINLCLAGVDQDIFLFEGTVRENLSMWDKTIPESDLVQAARDACIHDDIVNRVGGYDSLIQEGGQNFSGGQRQRIEIARALSSNPQILVMDEATAALDPLTEKIIDNNLRRRGCSCLIVAHRLSTIRDCDEIILLEKGRVLERGTHDELLALGGAYQKLIQETG
ncbi:NHLP family bacteriocin export ABC transporter peptidase/permease/ATPase subunit [Congregibacter variabilis]|uniref:NHLP family bacteriocin export ABC transporter peptidase/permease/ATPase subunit n=1 Tax=Congregibacter variabilis TaxID=3081200 RepID=A0ABZ0I1K0_9GAMM|nr:NHLP family bacteriocin export ABC transporter peptidase/permease/ATPase subunit [Congregibacter sp. IMCC43200]